MNCDSCYDRQEFPPARDIYGCLSRNLKLFFIDSRPALFSRRFNELETFPPSISPWTYEDRLYERTHLTEIPSRSPFAFVRNSMDEGENPS
jgi:hypothetical protein